MDLLRLIIEALTDEDLDFLCMDYFPRVFEQFSSGMSKTHKTQRLLEYCLRHIQFPHLFELIKSINCNKFAEYEDMLTKQDNSSDDQQRIIEKTLLSGKGLSDKGQTERGGKKNPP
ncbi:hypothetical protein KFU94_49685 [Chloroflexi bacterium TSY]|nr:hypothetical protein [Chloroflexi bacterium TSY]